MLLPTLLAHFPQQAYGADSTFNWKTSEEEAVSLLSRYIQIDTTNSTGNEIKPTQFLKEIFDREEIEARIIGSRQRQYLRARLRGDGSKKATVLHLDVGVGGGAAVEGAALRGERSKGCGALDDKGSAIMELMAMLVLKRQKTSLKGDVIFLGTSDEEAGGALGASYLIDKIASCLNTAAWC